MKHIFLFLSAVILTIIVTVSSSDAQVHCEIDHIVYIPAHPGGKSVSCFAWEAPALNLHVLTIRQLQPNTTVLVHGYEKRLSGGSWVEGQFYDPPKRLRGEVSVIVSELVPAFRKQAYRYIVTISGPTRGYSLIIVQHNTDVRQLAIDAVLPLIAMRFFGALTEYSIEELGLLPEGTAVNDFLSGNGIAGLFTTLGGNAAWTFALTHDYIAAAQDGFVNTLIQYVSQRGESPLTGDIGAAFYSFVVSLYRSIHYNTEPIMAMSRKPR